jgi:DNA-binding MarR family transcriptional regulator
MSIIQSIDNQDRSALSHLAAALLPFKEICLAEKQSMPPTIVSTFLAVARKEGQTVSELARAANVSMATMSRQLSDLTTVNRYGAIGLGLIEQRFDLDDQRYQRSYLTTKGVAFSRRVAMAMRHGRETMR